jgi:hypothetical protein
MTDQIINNPETPKSAVESPSAIPAENETNAPLFHDDEGRGFRTRWEAIQTGFVDEPRKAVEQADALVSETIKRLSDVFAEERTALEKHWGRGENVSTEDLRIALKRYRSFFERLLHI